MSRTTKPAVRRPGHRGWRGRGGGAVNYLDPVAEWRGTAVQVCGLWPYGAGSGTPTIGVPLGRNLTSGATVCCDPISWFQRAALIHNPSAFVLGRPGLGKSTIVRRMALGLSGYGVMPLIFGDLRPDYVDLVRALGGQVITLGRGRGYLNVLDPGAAGAAAARLTGDARRALDAEAHGRRLNTVSALVTILRGAPPSDREETILSSALLLLAERHDGVPVLSDLVRIIHEAPPELRVVALDRGDMDRYRDVTEPLEASLMALLGQGRLGELFARPTSENMRHDRPVVFDVSDIDDGEVQLQAAALLACWSAGFQAVEAAQALAEAGLEPRRRYFVILDELWRVLRAGRGLVDRVDALTRLNRARGVGMAMITHTMDDLLALPHPEDRAKATGFVERAGMVICGGLPRKEMPSLSQVVGLSSVEQTLLDGWATPPTWDSDLGKEADPPGRGNFLIKVGGRPGIPVHVDLTTAELAINDTNRIWKEGGPR
ncbi:ATP/GTP-binding protein [Streptomyces sp. AV19]|uniref:ATP/GTP-binding protein n=1 Tax=Streptomyces sp. AV19 TaxID=2793068 RepID=UPI0018FEF8DB|nr:ATP/GTP-binding protein [Streptomyces sp. AV19]MBH1934133.1 ATP/GTP-binding protein [Streptomyces sp. AV19]MDG4537145.1 type IV secretory system conjugative DNA transfer family protein [Streptomyces sp. AV19]